MKEIVTNITDYFIEGKPLYPVLRRSLNLLFNISISSFLFQKFYGQYTWLDIVDYKLILNFFIKGEFFIPFSIFFIVSTSTHFFAVVLFTILNHFKSVKVQRKILSYQYNKKSINVGLQVLKNASSKSVSIDLTPEIIVETYIKLRQNINDELFEKLEEELSKTRKKLEDNFILTFRAFIAITIYKISLPQFGWFLYLITTLLFVLVFIFLNLAQRLIDILPTVFRVFHKQAEIYVNEVLNSKIEK